jgi:excisionase family DNA binding protein
MSISEVGDALKVSTATVHRYIRTGKIRSTIKIGRKVLVEPTEVARVVQANRTTRQTQDTHGPAQPTAQ